MASVVHCNNAWWSALDLRVLSKDQVEVLHTIEYLFDLYLDDRTKVTLPVLVSKGFVCDLASIPAWARSMLPSKIKTAPASILHDWLYRYAQNERKHFDKYGVELTRYTADTLFECLLREDPDVSALSARLMRFGVRLGGSRIWNWYRKLEGIV